MSDRVNTPFTNSTFPFLYKVLYCFAPKYDAKHKSSDAAAERVRKVMILKKKIVMLDNLQCGES
jgi:hypothetical protein